MSKFFHYRQNNSGGIFIGDYEDIIIEADDSNHADYLAENTTDIYFDGCDKGYDCSCCGDRWSRAWLDDGQDTPMIYETPVTLYAAKYPRHRSILIRYKDGNRVIIIGDSK